MLLPPPWEELHSLALVAITELIIGAAPAELPTSCSSRGSLSSPPGAAASICIARSEASGFLFLPRFPSRSLLSRAFRSVKKAASFVLGSIFHSFYPLCKRSADFSCLISGWGKKIKGYQWALRYSTTRRIPSAIRQRCNQNKRFWFGLVNVWMFWSETLVSS